MNFPIDLPPLTLALATEHHIDPKVIEEHHTHGGGHGGQKVNKSTNCVELHHGPTGIQVRVHQSRSLSRNREIAYALLIEKIAEDRTKLANEIEREWYKVKKVREPRPKKVKEKMLRDKKHRGEIKKTRRGE